MIVVSNASPLICLAKVNGLHLLRDLFAQVFISSEVQREVIGGGNRPGAAAIQSAGWIQVQTVKDVARLQQWRQTYRLGAGELATLILAQELRADLAVIDEHAARLLAGRHNVKVVGCVGVLEIAHQKGRLSDLRTTYQQLLAHGAHIDVRILNRSLTALKLPEL